MRKYYTAHEVSELSCKSRPVVNYAINQGEIKGIKVRHGSFECWELEVGSAENWIAKKNPSFLSNKYLRMAL